MFGKLKEKLKNWVAKNKEEETEAEIIEKPKKDAPTFNDSGCAERRKIKEEPETAKKTAKKKDAKKPEKTKEEVEEELDTQKEKPKKSFLSRFKKKTEEVPEEIKKEEKSEEKPKKKKLFQKALTKEKFEELFSELQIILFQHNVAYEAVESIESHLKETLVGEPTKEVNITEELKKSIENLLVNPPSFLDQIKSQEEKPFIILFAGINGSGKTTTIAKVANYLQKNSLSVCLAAADTFRAAAIQQLEEHGNNLKVPIIKKDYGADPASVGFDAIKYAQKHKIDVVLIDTAGRMQNSDTLMKEIEKITRVTKPHMKIFLGESTTGNDATLQAKAFNDVINLTGIILSKADVDESGGTAISVTHVTGKPILFLGTGQKYEDLEIFDKEKLIEKIFK